ncbi:MAG TPA: FtsX-like permease family protein, partial [Longimicrobiales bacterium]|nr:FtsX-like permease family protein [Longimicrobiales bacterium]
LPAALPAWGLTFDLRWIAVALCMSGLAAAAAGLVPSLHAARRDPARVLAGGRGSSHGRGAGRFQELMSASQLALATAGIAAVGLLGRSLADLARVDMGFEPGRAVTFRVTAPPEAYPGDGDVVRFFREVRAALAAVPSVERVGLGSRLPLAGGDSRISANPEGWQREEGAPAPEAWHRLATPGYLEALGVALLDGRIPGVEDDRDDLPQLAVVNRAAAERFWPGESAVGKRFYGPGGVVWLTVAGVVEDVRERGQQAAVIPGVYIPHRDWPWRTMYAVVRTRDEPMSLLPALQEAVRSVSAGVPISRVETLEEIVDGGLRPTRMLIAIAAVAGIVTLLLGGLGVYGVVSHAVARRRRELGVRAALGAGRGRLLRGAMGSATRIVALGLGAGLVLAWMAGRGLQAVLPGVDALDVPAFAAALAVLGSVAYAAAFLPARRAARVDPVQVMREE